jgi:hypothetical protein
LSSSWSFFCEALSTPSSSSIYSSANTPSTLDFVAFPASSSVSSDSLGELDWLSSSLLGSGVGGLGLGYKTKQIKLFAMNYISNLSTYCCAVCLSLKDSL